MKFFGLVLASLLSANAVHAATTIAMQAAKQAFGNDTIMGQQLSTCTYWAIAGDNERRDPNSLRLGIAADPENSTYVDQAIWLKTADVPLLADGTFQTTDPRGNTISYKNGVLTSDMDRDGSEHVHMEIAVSSDLKIATSASVIVTSLGRVEAQINCAF